LHSAIQGACTTVSTHARVLLWDTTFLPEDQEISKSKCRLLYSNVRYCYVSWNYMAYFTRGVNVGAITKVPNLLQYIISVPICHKYVLYKYWNIVLFYLLITKIKKYILLISDCLVSFYLGRYKPEGDVYYFWLIYFLHQFIPLVHHILFVRMYSSDRSN